MGQHTKHCLQFCVGPTSCLSLSASAVSASAAELLLHRWLLQLKSAVPSGSALVSCSCTSVVSADVGGTPQAVNW